MAGLFLIPQQGEVFLTLVCVGAALGAAGQLLAACRGRVPALSPIWDGLFALILGAALLWTLLRWREEGLRLYALLGVCIGAALYLAGPGSALAFLGRRCARKKVEKQQENTDPGAK